MELFTPKEAIAVRDMRTTGTAPPDAAAAFGSSVAYTAQKARIGWLAPGIIAAIIEGRQPDIGCPGDLAYVGELRIASELLVLDLVDLEEESTGFELIPHSSLLPAQARDG